MNRRQFLGLLAAATVAPDTNLLDRLSQMSVHGEVPPGPYFYRVWGFDFYVSEFAESVSLDWDVAGVEQDLMMFGNAYLEPRVHMDRAKLLFTEET